MVRVFHIFNGTVTFVEVECSWK